MPAGFSDKLVDHVKGSYHIIIVFCWWHARSTWSLVLDVGPWLYSLRTHLASAFCASCIGWAGCYSFGEIGNGTPWMHSLLDASKHKPRRYIPVLAEQVGLGTRVSHSLRNYLLDVVLVFDVMCFGVKKEQLWLLFACNFLTPKLKAKASSAQLVSDAVQSLNNHAAEGAYHGPYITDFVGGYLKQELNT